MHVGGLLFDGNGGYQIANERGHKALGEQILRGDIVHRPTERHTHKELVKCRLVVHQNEILSVALLGKACYSYALFETGIQPYRTV